MTFKVYWIILRTILEFQGLLEIIANAPRNRSKNRQTMTQKYKLIGTII